MAPRHDSPAGTLCEAAKQLPLQHADEAQQAEEELKGTRLSIGSAPVQLSANKRTHA